MTVICGVVSVLLLANKNGGYACCHAIDQRFILCDAVNLMYNM